MKPYALIIDDFFPQWEIVRQYFDTAEFESQTNPFDGLPYPTVHALDTDRFSVGPLLEKVFGCRISLRHLIARLSLQDKPKPYNVHSDAFMGADYTAIVYLNRSEDALMGNGTTLCEHSESGLTHYDGMPQYLADSEKQSCWKTVLYCPLRSNRAFIFPSAQLHYSGHGFGSNQREGRLVLVCLFSLAGLSS